MDISRRNLIQAGSGLVLTGATMVSGRSQAAAIPEAPSTADAATQPPLVPTTGPDYQPVVTLNGWTLPWRMSGDWKEFHLVAEPVIREMAPGMKAHLWGYNGQSPGPTIEAVEGAQPQTRPLRIADPLGVASQRIGSGPEYNSPPWRTWSRKS